jgi:predicted transcriptional regulator
MAPDATPERERREISAGGRVLGGELQHELMRALWRLGGGTVEEVRAALPESQRSAYTTVQTVLNRLAQRGLLKRRPQGKALVYAPLISEAEHIALSLRRTLDSASNDARAAALAELLSSIGAEERVALESRAKAIERRRAES